MLERKLMLEEESMLVRGDAREGCDAGKVSYAGKRGDA